MNVTEPAPALYSISFRAAPRSNPMDAFRILAIQIRTPNPDKPEPNRVCA